MRSKPLFLLLLSVAFVALTGESCFLENKNVEVPYKDNYDMQFTSQGFNDTDTQTVDFGLELQDLENDAEADIEDLVSASIEAGFWRLLVNRGPASTMITGSITVRRVSTGESATLVSPQSVTIENVGMEFMPAPLEAAGLQLLTDGFDEYVSYRNGEIPFPDLRYEFDWISSSNVDADFDWEARLRYNIVGVFSVDVPEVW